MSHMVSAMIDSRKRKNDVIYTPIDLVLDCIRCTPIQEGDTLLDGFMGDGVFYNNFPDGHEKDWCEIEKGRDFYEYKDKVDWVISNPPFSKLNKILDHLASICNKGFGLIMGAMSLTVPRQERMARKGFNVVHYFPVDVKDWDGFLCCYVVFQRGGSPLWHVKRY